MKIAADVWHEATLLQRHEIREVWPELGEALDREVPTEFRS